ncbi:hypothetical protein SteCoe_13272 [Stentor coeruleus]|uniref:Uncharacterized protein n=1 Tax=Stentor coeruleus TaxID=5963 RepID=A0A1R2C8U9_9CILI|nr:hypothetical protein SteCoe_13272 [Stentor coeruleus]
MDEEFKEINKIVRIPLLSRAGKAMKIPLPRSARKIVYSPKESFIPEIMTAEKAKGELKKIEAIKVKLLKESLRPKLMGCFKSVSRSSNPSVRKSPSGTVSPPPGSYNPKYEFMCPQIHGYIKYPKRIMVKSKSTKLNNLPRKTHSAFRDKNLEHKIDTSGFLLEHINDRHNKKINDRYTQEGFYTTRQAYTPLS